MMADLADVHSCSCVGQEFSSFEELNSALKLQEECTCVTLYTRSLKTVTATRKRVPKRHINNNSGYLELHYACMHGGREYMSHSKDKSKCQRYDKGCTAK